MVAVSGSSKAGHGSSGPEGPGAANGASAANAGGHAKTGCGGAKPDGTARPDVPDPRQLAQDWITLWQSELSAMAADAEVRESWQAMTAMWAGTLAAMIRATPRAQTARGYDRPNRPTGPDDAARSAPAAAASDARDAEIERLARHVAVLERRLADLERGGGNPPVHSKRPSRRRKTG